MNFDIPVGRWQLKIKNCNPKGSIFHQQFNSILNGRVDNKSSPEIIWSLKYTWRLSELAFLKNRTENGPNSYKIKLHNFGFSLIIARFMHSILHEMI
jgi:hypothetical protein